MSSITSAAPGTKASGIGSATGIVTHSVPAAASAIKAVSISRENYKYLQQEIYRESGIVLDEDKHYLLESRLTPIAREAKLASLDELCTRLQRKTHPALAQQVIEALTTNETLFFRDMAPFDALRKLIVPEILEKKPARLTIWSAAASSGQEAYSIAMLLQELKPALPVLANLPVDILGTDLSEQILNRAREAKYVQFEVNRGLPAPYLVKYFQRTGLDWQLKEDIRNMVRFRRFDLRQPMAALGKFDIVFCRNVLIYFDVETKIKILNQLHSVLNPGGFLLLGGAETVLNLQGKFERVAIGTTAAYRKR
jgi:chemotaxis protein methyltransferase CheR